VDQPSEEKRQTPRIRPYVAPCRIVDGQRRINGYLTDLSARGARVACDVELPGAGSSVVLEARLGGRSSRISVAAEVKWAQASSGGGSEIGLTFQKLFAEDQRALEAAIEEFQRLLAQLA
jgi:PilZ domain